ncbi:hypothetical protein RB7026 [Rhodopirellula baltica SH 1]|uniref:Uncharacterized protein n=1 Tax=Rhodopirellula baltica (strain DSM 10527 / NCIMB 13988 / SH1) TaxID=243090 RepID=Q7UPC7_RHOBA|nr:hypothetical protein RB7026 [Rhodopirellula baltica SH 1]
MRVDSYRLVHAWRNARGGVGTPLCSLHLWMMKRMEADADRVGDRDGMLQGLGQAKV